MLEHRFVGSALHCRMGRLHAAQTYDSPSANDSASGVTEISVSAVFNFLRVEGSDCCLVFRATDTLKGMEQRGDAPAYLYRFNAFM